MIKALLLDQTFVAGIGNIYADEALFRAGIHPTIKSDQLTDQDTELLHQTIRDALNAGIEHEGASINWYRKPDGSKGNSQDHFYVYGREDKSCKNCGASSSIRFAWHNARYPFLPELPTRKARLAMIDLGEFLGQTLPLFVQILGLPIVIGIAYFVYQRRKQQGIESESTVNEDNSSITEQIDMPTIDKENDPMTNKDQSTSNRPNFDTGDLPPLDMLIGALDDEPVEEPEPVPAPSAPPQVVQLRKMTPGTTYAQLDSGQNRAC